MRIASAVILGSMLCAQGARAQEVSAKHEVADEWSESFIDRPLILAPRMVQANLGVDVSSISDSANSTGETVGAAFDVGIAKSVQAGLALSFPVNPATFGSAIANVQLGIADGANLRFDAGVARSGFINGSMDSMSNLYEFGLGVPIKLKLTDQIAFISGRTGAAGFGRPMALADGNGGIAFGSNPIYMSDALFAAGIQNGVTSYTAGVPVGILIAPHERVAIALRTGYRYVHTGSGDGVGQGLNFVPLGGDVMVNLPSHFDVGVSADVAGPLGQNYDYLAYRQFMGFAQARF